MESRKGKVVAGWAVVFGLAVLSLALYSFRLKILEEWYLYQLKNGDADHKKTAARRLGDMGAARAIPLLLRLPPENPDPLLDGIRRLSTVFNEHNSELNLKTVLIDDDLRKLLAFSLAANSQTVNSQVPFTWPTLLEPSPTKETSLETAVRLSGKVSIPYLRDALRDKDQRVRYRASAALVRLADKVDFTLSLLEEAHKETDDILLRIAVIEASRRRELMKQGGKLKTDC